MASYTDLSRAWHNHQLNWTRTRKQTFLPPIIKPVPIRANSATPLPVHSVAGPDASVSTGVLGGERKDVDAPVIGPVAPASAVIASMEDEKGILTVLTDVPVTNKRKADEPIPTPAPAEKKMWTIENGIITEKSADASVLSKITTAVCSTGGLGIHSGCEHDSKDLNFGESNTAAPGLGLGLDHIGLEQVSLNFPVNGLATYFPAPTVTVATVDEKDKMEYETDFDEKKN